MSGVKVFETAVAKLSEEDFRAEQDPEEIPPDLEWDIEEKDKDGKVLHVQHCKAWAPNDGQLGYLMAATAGHRTLESQAAAAINLIIELCDEATAAYIEGRLLDRLDPYGLGDINNIMQWMLEQWSGGFPTQPQSGSAPSRRTGGRKSTRTTTRGTSSGSRSTATSASSTPG